MTSLIHPGGNTNTSGGIYKTLTGVLTQDGGDRPEVQNIAIIITDGKPTRDYNLTFPYAELLQQRAKVFVVGVTDQVDADILQKLSSQPRELDKNYFESASFDQLRNIVGTLLETTCVATTPAPTGKITEGPASAGYPCRGVTVAGLSGVEYR